MKQLRLIAFIAASILLCFQTLVLLASTAYATDYYVSTTGTDELQSTDTCTQAGNIVNCAVGGSITAPWRTLQKATACAKPGDTVYVRAGTYGVACTQGFGKAMHSLKSGTPQAPITWKPYPGEVVQINGQVHLQRGGGASGDYNILEGFKFKGGGIEVATKGSIIRNNEIFNVSSLCNQNNGGIRLNIDSPGTGGATDTIVENNVIHDNFERVNNTLWSNVSGFSNNCAGIKLMHNVRNTIIRGNVIYNEPSGIHLKYNDWASNTTITNNTFYNVEDAVYGSNSEWTFTNNIVYNAQGGTEIGAAGVPGGIDVTVSYNTFVNTGTSIALVAGDASVHHNIYAKAPGGPQTNVCDGLCSGGGYPNQDLSALTLNDNCFFTGGNVYSYGHSGGSTAYTLAQTQSTFGQETRSIFADPLFVNAAAKDYHLQQNSPCAAMGAYAQSGGPTPPPPAVCGNGVIEGTEQCDLGASNGVCPSVCTASCTTQTCTPTTKTGDLNNDGVVNILDVQRVVSKLGQSGVTTGEDVNSDSAVDIFDLVTIARNWG